MFGLKKLAGQLVELSRASTAELYKSIITYEEGKAAMSKSETKSDKRNNRQKIVSFSELILCLTFFLSLPYCLYRSKTENEIKIKFVAL